MPYTRRQVEDAGAALEPLLRLLAIYERIPGMAFGIAHDDTTILLGSQGVENLRTLERVDPSSTLFRCASITKSFTATIVMRLCERGLLRLDDPVTSLLPWTRPHLSKDLTVRHLLMHGGGVIRDGSNAWEGPLMPDLATVQDEVRRHGTFADPSERFRYSNVAYVLLGEIIETKSRASFATLLRREVARPLGLTSTWSDLTNAALRRLATGYWLGRPDEPPEPAEHAETRAIAPAGGLVSDVPDLLEYQRAHLPGDTRLLTEYAKREMQRPQWQRGSEPHYGLGWMVWNVGGIRVVGHSGGFPGFITKIGFAPAERLTAAVLTNAQSGAAPKGLELVYHVIASVGKAWDAAAASTRWHTRGSLRPYVGVYRSHGADLVVARVNGSLFLLDPTEAAPFEVADRLEPTGANRFRIADGFDFGFLGEEVAFQRDRAGAVRSIRVGAHLFTRSAI